jgi:type VI secretion system protein ImpC
MMKYSMNFGRLSTHSPQRKRPGDAFRIAVLGDFSGRSNAGSVEAGQSLAARKPHLVDVDNFEAVFRRWNAKLRLPIGPAGAAIEVQFQSLEDFHPDQFYNKLDIFRELGALRRRLKSTSTFAAAASEMQSWPAFANRTSSIPAVSNSRGSAMPPGKLSDFARLIGQTQPAPPRESPVDELIKQVMAPYVVPAAHPDQAAMVAAVDEALSATMRRILHHPDLQALEALWRSVDLLTRELETSSQLQIILYDITADEIAADLSSTDALESSGLYQLIVYNPVTDQRVGPPSVLVGNFIFDQTPPHAELLGRISKVAAAGAAPFIAGISTDCLVERDPGKLHRSHRPAIHAALALRRCYRAHRVLRVRRVHAPSRSPRHALGERIDPRRPAARQDIQRARPRSHEARQPDDIGRRAVLLLHRSRRGPDRPPQHRANGQRADGRPHHVAKLHACPLYPRPIGSSPGKLQLAQRRTARRSLGPARHQAR